MRTSDGDKVFAVLRQHDGAANAIIAPKICRELGWTKGRERLVRRLIADESALWEGWPVCSIPGVGFFVAQSIEELVTYENWLTDLSDRAQDKVTFFREACRKIGIRLPDHHNKNLGKKAA